MELTNQKCIRTKRIMKMKLSRIRIRIDCARFTSNQHQLRYIMLMQKYFATPRIEHCRDEIVQPMCHTIVELNCYCYCYGLCVQATIVDTPAHKCMTNKYKRLSKMYQILFNLIESNRPTSM
jgi:hypothetical protein